MTIQVQHPRCPFCHEPVHPEQRKAPCHACMTWNHADCWAEHGACAACGQGMVDLGAAAPPAQSSAAAGQSRDGLPLSNRALGDWLLERSRHSELALVKAVLAAARLALPADAAERGALALLAAWTDCPCKDHARDARDSAILAQQLSLDGGTLEAVRYATLAAVALRMPSIRLHVQGVGPFVHALDVAGAALAARRGATRPTDQDRLEVQTLVARSLG